MNRSVTIKDVAKAAGVSTATISRVLNKTGYVSEEARRQVLDTIDRLNYEPNVLARSLKQERSRSVGMIVPDMTNSYFMKVSQTLQRKLLASGYHLLFMDTQGDSGKEAEALDLLTGMRVEAIVLAGTGDNAEKLQRLMKTGKPVILLDRDVPGVQTDSVMENNAQAAYEAAAYLLQKYGERVAVIHGPADVSTAKERRDGAAQAFREAGVQLSSWYEAEGDFTRESGRLACERLLRAVERPRAIFCANNEMTFGLLLGLHEAKIDPGDIEIVTYGNLDFAPLLPQKLSVIMQEPVTIGEACAELVLMRLEDRPEDQDDGMRTLTFKPQFMPR